MYNYEGSRKIRPVELYLYTCVIGQINLLFADYLNRYYNKEINNIGYIIEIIQFFKFAYIIFYYS